jgi:hypothetical protein
VAGSADENGGEFQRAAERAARSRTGPVAEFVYLIRRTRNYWLVPVIVALLLTGFVVVGSSSTLAPLIYALF